MSAITTHVLDAALGKPAGGVRVRLEAEQNAAWVLLCATATDADGRCGDLAGDAGPGLYRLTFETGAYLRQLSRSSVYPEISIAFHCDGAAHYHLPLLLSDNSYTTYRGS